ncbi:DUF805 domain-containing protein [Streptomyces sp. NPDC050619]|uniref:DUF805 domain-containing protein n=1 Tax=Streptomyces sp. NPDC050619 TaxID=3157214 RepID=UPI003448AC13
MVSFSEAVQHGLAQTFSWEGRASRSEYWWFILFGIICYAPSIALTIALEFPIVLLVWLFLFVPTLGVFVRRMHDCGRTGWSWFWSVVPLIGPIVLLAFLCERGDPKTNEYGLPPGTKVDW